MRSPDGQQVIILNPTTPIGPNDSKPTPTGRIFVDFLNGKFPAYVDTGLNLVDVSEVARAHVPRSPKGSPGRRYILGGENLTLKQILDKMSAITGIPSPTVKIPFAVAATYAFFEEWITGRIRGKEPRATLEEVRMGRKKMYASSARAQQELGFRILPVYPAMRAAIDWFRANGYAPPLMTRTAIIAAMPGELKPLVRGWPHSTRNGVHFWAQRNEEEEWIAACAGAGQAAATRAFAAIEDGGPIDLVFSIGWAGALAPKSLPAPRTTLPASSTSAPASASNCDAGAANSGSSPAPRWPTQPKSSASPPPTTPPWSTWKPPPSPASPPCAASRFTASRASATASTRSPARFQPVSLAPTASFQTRPVCSFCLFRPWYWPALIRMGENSRKASQSIAESLLDFLDERGHIRKSEWLPKSPTLKARRLEPKIPSTMRAVVYRGINDMRVETVPVPRIGPGRTAGQDRHLRHLRHRSQEDPHGLALRAAHLRPRDGRNRRRAVGEASPSFAVGERVMSTITFPAASATTAASRRPRSARSTRRPASPPALSPPAAALPSTSA
jgi:hypothetical protein